MIKQLAKQVVFGTSKQLTSYWNKQRLRGNVVYCPCCDSQFKEFLPYGGRALRPNACCPQCGSVERHRLMWLFLERETNLFKEDIQLLHIGPQHFFIQRLKNHPKIQYTFGDLSPDYFMKARGAQAIDVTAIQFPNNTFDAILCNHVLEHVPNDQKAMQELLRVLKPGGWAILQVPLDASLEKTYEDFSITSPEEREKAFGQKDHVRWYGQDYPERLRQAGFDVTPNRYIESVDESEIERMRLDRNETLFFCTKPQ